MSRNSWSVGGSGEADASCHVSRFILSLTILTRGWRMEGLRLGHDPEDRQSGDLLEGIEWGRSSSVGRGEHICDRRVFTVGSQAFLSMSCEWRIYGLCAHPSSTFVNDTSKPAGRVELWCSSVLSHASRGPDPSQLFPPLSFASVVH